MISAPADWFLALVREPVFWLWCRWQGHGAFPVRLESIANGPDVRLFRACCGCNRLYGQDVKAFLDAMAQDLDAQP